MGQLVDLFKGVKTAMGQLRFRVGKITAKMGTTTFTALQGCNNNYSGCHQNIADLCGLTQPLPERFHFT